MNWPLMAATRGLLVPPNESSIEPLWTTADFCARLNIAQATAHQWRWKGIGPVYLKLANGAVRYRPQDVEAWLDGQARTSTSAPEPPAVSRGARR